MEASSWQCPLVSIIPIGFCPLYPCWDIAGWGGRAYGIEWNVGPWAQVPFKWSLGFESGRRRGHGFHLDWLNSHPGPALHQWMPLLAWAGPSTGSMWTMGVIWMGPLHQLGMNRFHCLNWDHLNEKNWFRDFPSGWTETFPVPGSG